MIKDPKKIASYIDHTNIDKNATKEEIKKVCDEAKKYNFRGVCVNPEWAEFVSKQLEGTDIKTVVLVDPPMGLSPHEKRVEICEKIKEEGGDNIDIVLNVIDLKYEKYNKILKDLKEISKILYTKVIIGSGYLTDKEIKEAGADCVKTATEKDPLGHHELKEKARHVEMMKKHSGGLTVKAAGKVRTVEDLNMMVEAGADIIGTSTGVEITEEAKRLN